MKKQRKQSMAYLMILIINAFFILMCSNEKLLYDFGNEKLYYKMGKDTIGILKDNQNLISREASINIFKMKNGTYINFFDEKLLCIRENNEFKELNIKNLRPLGIIFKQLNASKIIFSCNEKIYILNENLSVLHAPLDSVFKNEKNLKKEILGDWSYSIKNDSLINFHFIKKDNVKINRIIKF